MKTHWGAAKSLWESSLSFLWNIQIYSLLELCLDWWVQDFSFGFDCMNAANSTRRFLEKNSGIAAAEKFSDRCTLRRYRLLQKCTVIGDIIMVVWHEGLSLDCNGLVELSEKQAATEKGDIWSFPTLIAFLGEQTCLSLYSCIFPYNIYINLLRIVC